MKFLFATLAALLLAGSVITARSIPGDGGGRPVLYWATDPNPARLGQVELFQKWLATNHPDQQFDVRVDSGNGDLTKRIIQGVSGVGDDLIDTYGSNDVHYFQTIGMLRDLTPEARRLGFGLDHTYPAIADDLSAETPAGAGDQYAFPCGVSPWMFLVNRDAFTRRALPLPPKRWTFEAFEQAGLEFKRAANPVPAAPRAFIADSVPLTVMRRSLGLDTFNETGTRCILDRPANARVLSLNFKWTYVDRILPSDSDRSAAATTGGYAGAQTQLLADGQYAMLWTGRHMLGQLRKVDADRAAHQQPPIALGVSAAPCEGFESTVIHNRAAAVYAAGKHPDLTELFLQFLASPEYGNEVIADADGLPPDSAAARTTAFTHPPDHPEEWAVHSAFADAANSLAIADGSSPFVLGSVVRREDQSSIDACMSGLLSPQQAAVKAAGAINDEIDRTLTENPKLQTVYRQLCDRQRQIDSLRAAGKPVPTAWITSPFYRAYYRWKGWLQ